MNNNNWLDIDVLEDYLDGKLDAKTMHRVERLSLEDPFVAEALAGLSLSPKRVQSLSLLQKQLQDRIAQKPIAEKRWQITSQRLSIAAAAAVLFVTVSLLFWMRESSNREKIAANTPKKVEVVIAPSEVTEKPKVEVDKVIASANKNTYASRSRKVISPMAVIVQPQDPEPALENVVIQPEQKKESTFSAIPSALKGKVAGIGVQPIPSKMVKGVVYDERKLPIAGVSVKLNGSSLATATNTNGEFSLSIDSALKDPKLSVAYLGYMPKEVIVKTDQNISIELLTNSMSLNEVVVTGYGVQKKQVLTGSASTKILVTYEPEGGWDKFEEYIINNNKLLKDKKLTGRYIAVRFKLNKDGRPVNITALNTPNMVPKQTDAERKEAIRLVKDGPKWILPPNKNSSSLPTVDILF